MTFTQSALDRTNQETDDPGQKTLANTILATSETPFRLSVSSFPFLIEVRVVIQGSKRYRARPVAIHHDMTVL